MVSRSKRSHAAAGHVGQVDAGGRESGSPRSVVMHRGVVDRTVATTVHLGSQVVISRAQTPELLFGTLGPKIATAGDMRGRAFMTERELRPIAAMHSWIEQRRMWNPAQFN